MDMCPYCDAETRPGDNFCLNCGNRLLPATPSFQQAPPIIGDTAIQVSDDRTLAESATVAATLDNNLENPARFIVRDDKGEVLQEYRLEKSETVIGRAPASDILLSKDKLTSRRHAVVRYENGDYVLSDERSANGTFVNGQQLEELVPRVLKDGDHVGIGEHELIFRTSSGVEDLPTISVPSDAVGATVAKEVTYRTREDEQMTAASSNDFSTRSMSGGGAASVGVPPSSVPASPTPQPVAVSPTAERAAATPGEAAAMPRIPLTPSVSSFASSEAPAASDTGITFNRLTSLVQPTLREDTSSQDTTKVLSLFAIARTTLEQDDRAFVRKAYSVEAGISQSKPEGFEGEPFKLPLRSNIRFLFLDILLHTSSNIELISHWQRRLRYDSYNPEPQLVAFKFKVVAPGSCSLAIDFYYERRWLRTVRFQFDAVEQSQLTAISSEG